MKIKVKEMSFDEVEKLPPKKTRKPQKPNIIFKTLLKVLSKGDLKATNFECNKINMDKLKKDEPCIILMNHSSFIDLNIPKNIQIIESSFIDLKIASTVMYPRPMNIVCTSDGFIGKEWLMYNLGCIPTNKFVTDVKLMKDIMYCIKELKSSILMYPEASYTFDGTATPLPKLLGKLLKKIGVPFVMIKTYGAFLRDPLYNNLQLRNVKVTADVEYVLSAEQIKEMSAEEIDKVIEEKFTFDNFRYQQEHNIIVNESFRADCLNRVLYRCPHCNTEGNMSGKGITIKCNNCNTEYELTENGYLKCLTGEGKFNHIPDWFKWEREEVRKEIEEGRYNLDVKVDICVMVDTQAIYKVGSGRLTHTKEGFTLVSDDGKINYKQDCKASYSLYADYYWYELGDIICIGNNKILYYCFPKDCGDIVAKTRLATEELYKMNTKK